MAESNEPMSVPQPSRDEMLARARAMVPAVRERAHAAEAGRRVPEETLAELHERDSARICFFCLRETVKLGLGKVGFGLG